MHSMCAYIQDAMVMMVHHSLSSPASFSSPLLPLNPPPHRLAHHHGTSVYARISREQLIPEAEEAAEAAAEQGEERYAPYDGTQQQRPKHRFSNGSLEAPWKKDSARFISAKTTNTFRPAPWQQQQQLPKSGHDSWPWKRRVIGTKESDVENAIAGEEARRKEYDNGRSALAQIVEKLRDIQDSPLEEYSGYDTPEEDSASFPWERRIDSGTEEEEEEFPSSSASLLSSPSSSIVRKIEDDKIGARRNQTRADLLIPPLELKRLRLLAAPLLERLKIGKLGVSKNIVRTIQEEWISSELVKVRCHGPAADSIKKIMSDLEKNTGGLVVWRDKNAIAIYRGSDYNIKVGRREVSVDEATGDSRKSTVYYLGDQKEELKEMEIKEIMEALGPRYENWTGLKPIPIDGDLLPTEVPKYRPPFRLLPFGVRSGLTDAELTRLRRLARPIAPHFVLARNKGHQGLAVAMVKLWEKTEIVKIAVKKRRQNTNNELMANEIRRLTGGVLLSRDKFFITFYRGKDFVPQSVACRLSERELICRDLQEEEEKARNERNILVKRPPVIQPSMAVIRPEAPSVKPSWVYTMDIRKQNLLKLEVAKLHQLTLIRQLERKLNRALKKKEKAEQELQKVEVYMQPIERPVDIETITEEERFMYRRLGIRMRSTLLLGVRGVFDGIVENMHLHWKHRELVKLVVHESDPVRLQETARMLEYESGGILISIIPSPKNNVIIMYRGKNYERPLELRPRNLLTKRKALKRAIEMQRRASLLQNIRALETEILQIKGDLHKMENATVDDDRVHSGSSSTMGVKNAEELTHRKTFRDQIETLERIASLGPIHRANPLTNTEKLELSKKALLLNKPPQFFVGQSNNLDVLASRIRVYFLHHDLVKIVVEDQGPRVSFQDLVQRLENLTGGVFVSKEGNTIVFYRGWPEGKQVPLGSLQCMSPDQRVALQVDDEEDLIDEDDEISNGIRTSDEGGEHCVSDTEEDDLWGDDETEDADVVFVDETKDTDDGPSNDDDDDDDDDDDSDKDDEVSRFFKG